MPKFLLSIQMQDAWGDKRRTTKRFTLDVLDWAAAGIRAGTFLTAWSNITGLDVLKYTLGQETPYTDTVTAEANMDAGATISCDLGGGKRAALKIPAPEVTILNADGSVDLTDALVTALESEYLSGDVTISDGEVVLDFLSGKLDK